MNGEREEKIQRKLELITRKWWFFLLFLLLQFIPPYVSKGYNKWYETWAFIPDILGHALYFSCAPLYPIFKIIPIILVVSIIFLRNRVTRLFNVYVAITYVLFAFLQSIAVTERYGLGIVTVNLVMLLIVAAFWFWEGIVRKNNFTPRKQLIWKYWVIPLAFLAFLMPINLHTGMPDFDHIYDYAVITTSKVTYFITCNTGKILWKYEKPSMPLLRFTDNSLSSHAELVAISSTTSNRNMPSAPRYVHIVAKNGKQIWEQEYSGEGFESPVMGPFIRLSSQSNLMRVASQWKIYFYQLTTKK